MDKGELVEITFKKFQSAFDKVHQKMGEVKF